MGTAIATVPDTAEELLHLIDRERGIPALFWALSDEGDILAHTAFRIWKGEGTAFAKACAEGLATKYRVVCEAMDLDWTDEWDDRASIQLKIIDAIKFHFTLRTFMSRG